MMGLETKAFPYRPVMQTQPWFSSAPRLLAVGDGDQMRNFVKDSDIIFYKGVIIAVDHVRKHTHSHTHSPSSDHQST